MIWNIDLPINPMASPALPFKPVFLINVMTADRPVYQFTGGELNFKNMIKPYTFCLKSIIIIIKYNKI